MSLTSDAGFELQDTIREGTAFTHLSSAEMLAATATAGIVERLRRALCHEPARRVMLAMDPEFLSPSERHSRVELKIPASQLAWFK